MHVPLNLRKFIGYLKNKLKQADDMYATNKCADSSKGTNHFLTISSIAAHICNSTTCNKVDIQQKNIQSIHLCTMLRRL